MVKRTKEYFYGLGNIALFSQPQLAMPYAFSTQFHTRQPTETERRPSISTSVRSAASIDHPKATTTAVDQQAEANKYVEGQNILNKILNFQEQ